jgi:hypothetical protein
MSQLVLYNVPWTVTENVVVTTDGPTMRLIIVCNPLYVEVQPKLAVDVLEFSDSCVESGKRVETA